MQMQLVIINGSNKRVQLLMTGKRSLTPHSEIILGKPFSGGLVTVIGRGNAVIASVADGVNWAAADAEKLLILPGEVGGCG